jgi:hypothetical protein
MVLMFSLLYVCSVLLWWLKLLNITDNELTVGEVWCYPPPRSSHNGTPVLMTISSNFNSKVYVQNITSYKPNTRQAVLKSNSIYIFLESLKSSYYQFFR